jgi:hypothetical protein
VKKQDKKVIEDLVNCYLEEKLKDEKFQKKLVKIISNLQRGLPIKWSK